MKDLKASDVMSRAVVAARRHASSRDIALQLLNGLYSGVPVTDEEGKVIGVITEIDLLDAAMAGKELVKTTAEELMTQKVITVEKDTPVADIVKLMKEKNIIRLPVTDNGKLVGIVSRCDILACLIEPEFIAYM